MSVRVSEWCPSGTIDVSGIDQELGLAPSDLTPVVRLYKRFKLPQHEGAEHNKFGYGVLPSTQTDPDPDSRIGTCELGANCDRKDWPAPSQQ